MPVIYRRPDPAESAAARSRLSRLIDSPSVLPADPEPAPQLDPVPASDAHRSAAIFGPSWSGWRSRLTPGSLRGARLDPGRRGVAAVAAVATLAAALTAVGVWRSRPEPMEVAAPQVLTQVGSPSTSPVPTVVVAVAGGVRRPGLFTLPVGSRVADAIRAAGGVRPGTSVGLLNLARRLVDGEQVIVGAAAGAQPGTAVGPASGQGTAVNLNTATLEELDGLPGVGPVLARRILDYRAQHGTFRSVEQLRDVGGIGEAKFADLRTLVVV